MAVWFIELFNPGGGVPLLRCVAAGAALAAYLMWQQRRSQTPAVTPNGTPQGDRNRDRPLVGVGGDDR
jgi:hypothetical protein